MNDKQVILLVCSVAGLVTILLSLPLLYEKIGPNPFYGFRFRKSFKSREIWYTINKYGARRLMWSGISLIIAATGLYFVPGIVPDVYMAGCMIGFLIVFTIGTTQSIRYLKSL